MTITHRRFGDVCVLTCLPFRILVLNDPYFDTSQSETNRGVGMLMFFWEHPFLNGPQVCCACTPFHGEALPGTSTGSSATLPHHAESIWLTGKLDILPCKLTWNTTNRAPQKGVPLRNAGFWEFLLLIRTRASKQRGSSLWGHLFFWGGGSFR